MNKLSYKYKRPTAMQYGHTDVYLNEYECIGFIIYAPPHMKRTKENWMFVSQCFDFDHLRASNRAKLVEYLEYEASEMQTM